MSGLARALVQAGRLTAQQAETLHKKAHAEKTAFIDALIDSGTIDARTLASFCSETFGYPMLDFSAFNLNYLPEKVIDPKLMQKARVIALGKRGNKV
ncbi:MAG: type IV-A pilus assembly ATPase PilB, partial [Bacillota bacterium]